jgi:putative salt-induced outer membrane protein YdiY
MKHRKRKQKMKYVYKIRGYDKLFGEDYWLPEVYETYEQAFKYCKTNESVIRVSA